MLHKIFRFIDTLYQEPKTTALEDAIAGAQDAEKQALTEQYLAEFHASEEACAKARAEFQLKRLHRLQAFIASKNKSEPYQGDGRMTAVR